MAGRHNESGMPDPAKAADLADLIGMLTELRHYAGAPSYRAMAKRVGPLLRPPQTISHVTVTDLFNLRRRRLSLDLLVAIVRALGCDEAEVDAWRRACIRVHAAAKTGGPSATLRQLPADLATFTGRRKELDHLIAAAVLPTSTAPTVVITAIEGMAGVGKTQLAVHAAHELVRSGLYGDAQLYVNLRGFDAEHAPADPFIVLEDMLRALGVSAAAIPKDRDARAALFRDRLHDMNALLLLDNAADEQQVLDLLPASPTCLVLITSRRSLAGLDGAVPCALDTFSPAEAVELLSRIVGADRVQAELETSAKVVQACGLLPLAVAMAAARLRSRPSWQVADLVALLHNDGLTAVSTGHRSIDRVFGLSFDGLPADAQRMFLLLGLQPGTDISLPAAAALAGKTHAAAQAVLELLVDEHLLLQRAPGRYELHDLLRDYAVKRATPDADQTASQDTTERIASDLAQLHWWYLHTADAANRAITSRQMYAIAEQVTEGPQRLGFTTREAALAWLVDERHNLTAAIRSAADRGLHPVACALPRAMWDLFNLGGHWEDWIAALRIGLVSARACGDRIGEQQTLQDFGSACTRAGQLDQALEHYDQSLAIALDLGDDRLIPTALINYGIALHETGRVSEAMSRWDDALKASQRAGNRKAEATALSLAGFVNSELGDLPRAEADTRRALLVFREMGDSFNEGSTLSNLGRILRLLNRAEEALAVLSDAVAVNTGIGHIHGMAEAHEELGRAWLALGDHNAAKEELQVARRNYTGIDADRADQMAELLAALGSGGGRR